ncbi:MAG: STAS-like domain-containing protein [Candidatus Omnitrophica bacterium]|nr:STAS-like domain-containing protein [Candidatus Omnitrophota bacterium]
MDKKNVQVIRLADFGQSVGSRDLGGQLRAKVESLIAEGARVLFSFKGITIISSAFADEVFGKLFIELGENKFKESVTVNDFDSPDQKNLIMMIIKKGISFRRNEVAHS